MTAYEPLHHIESQNFGSLLARYRGNSRVFLTYYKDGTRHSELSYAQYVELVERCARKLLRLVGSQAPMRVVVVMSNSERQLIVFGALLQLGIAIVSVNPQEQASHVAAVFERSKAALIIADHPYDSPTWVFDSLDSLENSEVQDSLHRYEGSSEVCGLMVATSGTTGHSKMVCLSQASLIANAMSLARFHGLTAEAVHFCVLPLFHVNAFGFSFLATFVAGGRLVLNDRFRKDCFWTALANEKAQVVSVVPELLKRLCHGKIDIVGLEHLKYFVSAAAPLSKTLLQEFQVKSGVKVIQGYGLSEAVNFSLITPPDLSDEVLGKLSEEHVRPPAGVALDCNEVRIVNENSLDSLAECIPGEIAIRGRNLMLGYFDDPESSRAALGEGWLRTGDTGYYTKLADGTKIFFVTGRKKNIIKRNGETILIEEIEDELSKFPILGDLAVVGFPNDWTGEEVGLVLLLSRSVSPAALQSILHDTFPFFKRPKVIKYVEQIPRTASFKVQRRQLVPLFSNEASLRFVQDASK